MIGKEDLKKLLHSPIYKNYEISEDGKTSGIVVGLKKDERLAEFIKIKDKYFSLIQNQGLSNEEKIKLQKFS